MANWSAVARKADTLAVVLATLDTIYLYNVNGQQVSKIAITGSGFRMPAAPPAKARDNPRARAEWLTTFDLWSDIYWSAQGDFILSYQERNPQGAKNTVVRVGRDGRATEVISDTPRLLTVVDGDTLVFVRPNAEAPNVWALATWR
jgi:hypothetical protein